MSKSLMTDSHLNKARAYILTVGENAVELAATLVFCYFGS
jgi:hypothetical protein